MISEINDKLAQPGVEATEEAGLAGSWCSSLVTIAHPCLPLQSLQGVLAVLSKDNAECFRPVCQNTRLIRVENAAL